MLLRVKRTARNRAKRLQPLMEPTREIKINQNESLFNTPSAQNRMRYMETEHARAFFQRHHHRHTHLCCHCLTPSSMHLFRFYTVDKCFRTDSLPFNCVASQFLKWFMRIGLTTNSSLIQKALSPNESLRIISFILANFADGNTQMFCVTVSEMYETSDVHNCISCF